ncbi:MAG: nuclear transport factor 2 family protein [Candidatus Bathyarchaeota archaeon]|nr:MAG: nuclear transport factor 2 family protein [Candidatus Bathyarchaeota archaeon]
MVEDSPDFEALRRQILDLHRATIEAHWNKDVDSLVRDISEDFISVSNGEIRRPTQEEIRSTFANYLNSTEFSEYRDLREPIVDFSDDGSVAWSVVKVKVAGRTADGGSERDLDFTCAWITLYRRRGDRWMRVGEVSSFKQDQ